MKKIASLTFLLFLSTKLTFSQGILQNPETIYQALCQNCPVPTTDFSNLRIAVIDSEFPNVEAIQRELRSNKIVLVSTEGQDQQQTPSPQRAHPQYRNEEDPTEDHPRETRPEAYPEELPEVEIPRAQPRAQPRPPPLPNKEGHTEYPEFPELRQAKDFEEAPGLESFDLDLDPHPQNNNALAGHGTAMAQLILASSGAWFVPDEYRPTIYLIPAKGISSYRAAADFILENNIQIVLHAANTFLSSIPTATIVGSFKTTPTPASHITLLAVPKSIPNFLNIFIYSYIKPFFLPSSLLFPF